MFEEQNKEVSSGSAQEMAPTNPSSIFGSANHVPEKKPEKKPKSIFNPVMYGKVEENTDVDHASKINQLLEREKQHNKTESWNKLDKTAKIQKLHTFAEKYGKDNALALKDIKALKLFFKECLEKNKLQKTKDVQYNKDTREIIAIPSLFLSPLNRNFTLKIMDAKRVSTLKSLTPKRVSETARSEDENEES
jgi:hypothetical protein